MVDFLLKEDGDYLLLETGDKIIIEGLPIYEIHSTDASAELSGVFAQWRRAIKRRRADGVIEYQPHAIHTWQIPQMSVADFLVMQSLQGQALTELRTNGIDFRNNLGIYTSAVMRLVNGRQQGTRMLDVNIEFRVDVS